MSTVNVLKYVLKYLFKCASEKKQQQQKLKNQQKQKQKQNEKRKTLN